MNKVFKFNFLYFSLLCFIILNLSCEQADSYGNYIPEDDPFTYFFNINSEIINPLNTGIDYADTDDDYTEITIHLLKTLNGNNDYLVPNEEINISWTISNEDYQSFPKIEHNNSEISNGETLLVDDSGTAVLKWLDKGIYGDVIINCSFTDINSNTWKSSEQNDQSIEILNNTFTITPVTYNLDVAIDIKSDEGTNYEGDYSDFTDMDKIQNENTSYTEVNISLNKNEVNLPASLKSITIDLAGEFNQSDGYFLTANSEQVTDGDQILTDSEGNIKLYWIDQGKSGLIQFTCIYFPIMDNPLAPFNSFTVASQYEKVEEIIAYEYEPINLTNGIPALEPIEVRVKDEFQGGVEYIDVLINPGTCNNCPEIIWTNGTVSQTNSDGVASFFFTLSNEGVVEDNIELSYNFLISNSNLNCGSCINNELNSSAQAIAFELDTATAPEEVHIFELTLDPSPFIFNDLPEAVNDTTFSDSIIIEATVKREGGSGIENLPVYFENILPESGNSYGVLDQMAITDSDGIARNVLKNINTNNLDPSNPTDIITIKATIEGNDVTYEATTSTTIIAKSLENISHVNNMDFYFEQNINFTVEGVTFTDVVIAQVLDENSAPVQGVPIQFYLSTDDIGYISSDLEYSDSQGFATVAYNVNAADILLADGSQTTINISAYVNDDHNQNLDRTYYVDPVQLISTLELNLTPEVLIYNDLPGFETGVIDSIGISVYVKDAWGVGVPQIPVSFANNTPNYGILETPVVITDNLGIATNKLSNINTSSFDFVNNTTDIIEIYASAIGIDAGGFEELYDATSITTIVPQSLQNIWQVEQLDVYFAQQLSVINNITVAFSDTIVAQVLDENSVPVSGVPINFELVSENEVGYITSNLEISDVNGFARSIFHINPADFEAFDDVNDTAVITINTTVGEDFTDSITKSYQIEGNSYIEYEVDELYPVTYEPLDEVYSFGVEWDNSLESFEFQFRDLCFQAKDSDGVIIENVPIQFSLFSKNDETNGSLSESLVYSCCINGQDSTNTASLPYSNSELYYEYMIDLGYPSSIAEDTLGVGCLTYSVWDIAYEDFENPDSLYVTIADPNDQSTDIFNRTYALELNPYSYPQTVDASSFDLVMDPPQNTANDPLLLIYNDLPPNIDPALTDTVGLSVLVTDELGASISNVEIEFTNITNYGALTSTSVDTNEDGIAKNLLDNITSTFYEEFDYENEVQDIIEVQIDAIVNNESVATDIESILIIPQSIYNVNQVNSLSLNFNDPTNFTIYEADNSTFTDQIQAQVLTATNSPYGNVPIEFSLNSDFGYIPSSLEYTNSQGISLLTFQLPAANISELADSDGSLEIFITATVGDFSETISRIYTIIPIPTVGSIDLDAETDTFIFNDIPSDTTNPITEIGLLGIINDEFNAVLAGVTANFEVFYGSEYASIENSVVVSDSSGHANNKLVNIDTEEFNYAQMESDSIKVRMTVTNSENEELTDEAKVVIIPLSIANISKVDQLDTYFTQQLSTINNVTISISDTLVAQVLDGASTPVLNVPIGFELNSPNNIGYLTNEIGYSDSVGVAYTIYKITPADFDNFIDNTEAITINVSVGDNISETISRTYVIDATTNIEYSVSDFSWVEEPSNPIFAYPDTALVMAGKYNDIQEKFCFSAKNEAGVSISGVPIQFELSGLDNFGSLNTALAYTYPDSSYDAQSDTTCTNTTLGAACVCYNLPVSSENLQLVAETPDILRAHIPDPNNQTLDVIEDIEFPINIAPVGDLVQDAFIYAQPSFIAMDVLDSTYCDTIYAIAQNSASSPLRDIPILFTLEPDDQQYGLLSSSYAITDSLLYPPYIAATTQFCTHPNIDLAGQEVQINIAASIELSPLPPVTVQIPLSENIPECPDCEESLVITSDYYELPNVDLDGNDIFQANLSATVVDSTENPVPENTLVEWQALKEDDTGGLTEVIGSIDPYTFTDENGVANTIFSMMNDFGLAHIIATAPAFNLSDTTFISITSNDAAYIELIQPVPNEITVQGGGGIESTELQVEVKDNNGNLVTDDYLVYYRLANNSPSGTYFNDIGTSRTCVNSDNGIASVTLNSGNEPGSVQVIVAAYPLGTECESIECTDTDGTCDDTGNPEIALDDSIAQLSFTTVTVVTGPPNSGQINFSYVDILPIQGAGLYQVPLSVQLEDLYANPVADSTNVYIWIEGHKPHWCSSENVADEINFPGLENEDCTFAIGDTVKWGTDAIIDSLLYVLVGEIPFQQPLSDGLNFAPGQLNGQQFWLEIAHPGQVVGEAKTGMLGPDGSGYPGIAFSNAYYGTSEIFERTVLKAMTFGADEEMLIIDSRHNHNNEPLLLPFQPGTVTATTSLVTFDFSLFPHDPDVGGACDNGADDTQQVTVTGSLTDFFQYATGDGRLQITAPGATIVSACNPSDTDGDGFVGWCDEDGNGLQGEEELIPTCRDCVASQLPWIFDDSDNDGLVDDDPAVGVTDGTGQVVFIIEYSEVINIPSGPCPPQGGDIITYDDWQSDVILQLIDPIQAASNSVTITVQKTETEQ